MPFISAEQVCSLVKGIESPTLMFQGGQKCVFRASYQDQPIALKFVFLQPSPDFGLADTAYLEDDPENQPTNLRRAIREMSIMAECESPYLSKLGLLPPQVVQANHLDLLCYSETWIEGESLTQVLAHDHRLPFAHVVQMADEIAIAATELSSHKIVHRDIKPSNIMRRAQGHHWVLIDMGISLDLDGTSITGGGRSPGSPPYSSPEQLNPARKDEIDARSDMFSLGVVLYESSTGTYPFTPHGAFPASLEQRIQNDVPMSPRTLVDDYPQALEIMVKRLLSKEPFGRYRDWQSVREALAAIGPQGDAV